MANRKNAISGTVERKLYYYDLNLYRHCEKNKDNVIIKNQSETIREIFIEIEKIQNRALKEKDDKLKKLIQEKLEVPTENGDKLYVIVDKIEEDKPIEFRLVLCRDDAFPFVHKNGKLEFITQYLVGEFALAEITHCVIFTEKMVMGAEFNFNGSRPSAVADYIAYMNSSINYVSCRGKINNEAIDKISKDDALTLFELSIKNNSRMKEKLVSHTSFIGNFLKGAPDNVDQYEIILKRRKTKKKEGFQLPFSIEEIKDFVVNYKEDIGKFRIGQSAYKDSIDLLNDKLVHTSKLPIETNNKTIVSEKVYKEIRLYFNSTVIKYCK